MSRVMASLAFAANGIAFGLLTYICAVATVRHVQWGATDRATLTMASGFVALIVTLTSLMPTARANFTAATRSGFGRVVAGILAIVFIVVMGVAASVTLYQKTHYMFGVVPRNLVMPLFGLYAFLMLQAFTLPGFAYPRPARPTGWPAPPYQASLGLPAEPELPPQSAARSAITICSGTVALAIVLLGSFAMHGVPFLPSPEHAALVDARWDQIVVVGSLICGSWALVTRLKPGKGPFRNPVLQRLMTFAICVIGGFFLPPAAKTALPFLHALVFPAPEATKEVIVLALGDAHRRKHCSYTATVTLPDAPGYSQQLCSIPRDIWYGLKQGDHLMVSGTSTAFGQRTSVIYRP